MTGVISSVEELFNLDKCLHEVREKSVTKLQPLGVPLAKRKGIKR